MLLESSLPIAAAPMAGGPTTVELSRAVGAAGGFPFLAGGYKTPHVLAAEIEELRRTGVPFGVNLFVPAHGSPPAEDIADYAVSLEAYAERYRLRLDPNPVVDDDAWADKLDLLIARPVPIVSLTFGVPDRVDIARLQAVGTKVLATVTTPDEAAAAAGLGVDGLIVQGPSAGGHSATHDPFRTPQPIETAELVRQIRSSVGLAIVAAGGVDGPDAVRALIESGAESVAIGTLLLRTDEAGTSPTHRAALADPAFTETVITRAFTGRPARALRNAFIDTHGDEAPTAYPAVHHLTRALRQAAGAAGDPQALHLWAGTGYRNARTGPAAEVLRALSEGLG